MGERKIRGEAMQVRTQGGVVEVRWDERGTATAMGQLAFFAEYLEASGLFEGWLRTCPLKYSNPNAPALVDVLGTWMLSILARRQPDDAELAPLEAATRAMEAALARDDLDAWAAADERFHTMLLELAGNRQLQATVMNYWDRAHRARLFTLRLRPKPLGSTREHMQLVQRLRCGDAAGAAAVKRAHRERASRELLAIFERFKLTQM